MTTRTPRAVRRFHALLVGATATIAATSAVLPAPPVRAQTTDTPLLAACPIEGDHDLIDSWGWRRSGGRSHQGIDIIDERGTELYAVRDGWVNMKRNNLGGNAIWLTTDDGDDFYYAHLDAFEGDDRRVEAGDLIGYVGSTGNAGGPHLHFEVHPGGQVENPFDHVVEACRERSTQTTADAPVPSRTGSTIDLFLARLDLGGRPPIGTPHLRAL